MEKPIEPNMHNYDTSHEYRIAMGKYQELLLQYYEFKADEERAANRKKAAKYSVFGLATIALLMFIFDCFYVVPERHVGIVKRFGEAVSQERPGFHFKAPLIDSIEMMEIGIRKYEITMPVATIAEGDGGAAELQLPSDVTISANWNVPEKNALQIFKTYGGLEQFEDRILDPRVVRTTKAHFSKHSIEYIVSNRESIRSSISGPLTLDLKKASVTLSEFSIKDIKFNQKIRGAILAKQRAKLASEEEQHKLNQQNLEAQREVNTANADRDAAKARADGLAYSIEVKAIAEAEAIRLKGIAEAKAIKEKGKALRNNPLIVDLTHEQQWNGQYPTTVMGESANILWNANK